MGAVTVHRAQKSREPVLKLGDVREVVDFPLRVDSEIDKKYKDKGHKRKAPSAVGCVLAMRNPPPLCEARLHLRQGSNRVQRCGVQGVH